MLWLDWKQLRVFLPSLSIFRFLQFSAENIAVDFAFNVSFLRLYTASFQENCKLTPEEIVT